MTGAAAMIDPLLSPFSARRSAAAPRPQRRKRAAPARTSKIFAAGASATALLSMVAAMGWQSGTGSANSAEPAVPVAETTPAMSVIVPVAPTTTSVVAPVSVAPPVTTPPAVTVAVVLAPVATPAPVVVPRAVAVVKLPVQKATKKLKSNTTTKQSG